MLRALTVLIQLLVSSVEATQGSLMDSYKKECTKMAERIGQMQIKLVGDKQIISNAKVQEFMTDRVEPLFSMCKNDISRTEVDSDSKLIAELFMLVADKNKIVKILEKEVPSFLTGDNQETCLDVANLVFSTRIFEILIATKAVPTIKIDGNGLSLSLRGMIEYLFDSLRLLVGETVFEASKEIKQFISSLVETKKAINDVLKECCNKNGNLETIGQSINTRMLRDLINDKKFYTLDNYLRITNFDGTDKAIQKRRYLNVYNLVTLIDKIFFLMSYYIDILTGSNESPKSGRPGLVLVQLEWIARYLLIFAIPKSKMNQFMSELEGNGMIQPFEFSIFDKKEGDFERRPENIDVDNWLEKRGWEKYLLIITCAIFGSAVLFMLVNYLRKKKRNQDSDDS